MKEAAGCTLQAESLMREHTLKGLVNSVSLFEASDCELRAMIKFSILLNK
jgi:hypothetical protein